MVEDAQLKKLREAIAADRSGKELVAIVADLRKKGYDVEGQELKRVPPPYPQNHPRGDLLRHKRLIYWKRWPVEPWIATPRARARVATAWRDGAPRNAWCAWKRKTASSSLVGITTGGTELLNPCGSSTATYGILLSCKNLTVRSAFFTLNQLPCRNSTAIGRSRRARVSRMSSRASFEGKTHFGNWTKTAPSLRASTRGSSASRNCA